MCSSSIFRVSACVFCSISLLFDYMCVRLPLVVWSIAGVPSSQELPGFLITASPSVCVPDVICPLTVWIHKQNKWQRPTQEQPKKQSKFNPPPGPGPRRALEHNFIHINHFKSKFICPRSNAGVPLDSVGRFRATLLLCTTCMRSCCTWIASCMAAYQTQKPKNSLPLFMSSVEQSWMCSHWKLFFCNTIKHNKFLGTLLGNWQVARTCWCWLFFCFGNFHTLTNYHSRILSSQFPHEIWEFIVTRPEIPRKEIIIGLILGLSLCAPATMLGLCFKQNNCIVSPQSVCSYVK